MQNRKEIIFTLCLFQSGVPLFHTRQRVAIVLQREKSRLIFVACSVCSLPLLNFHIWLSVMHCNETQNTIQADSGCRAVLISYKMLFWIRMHVVSWFWFCHVKVSSCNWLSAGPASFTVWIMNKDSNFILI